MSGPPLIVDRMSKRLYMLDMSNTVHCLPCDIASVPGLQAWITWAETQMIQADWTETNPALKSYVKHKPTLAAVATSGSYIDLSNKPTIPAAQVNSDWAAGSGLAQILNKPTFSTVATTGAYSDLTGKPTIPAAQIQSDWTQTNSGSLDFIKNKPADRTQSVASRSLNTAFQISSTRDCLANYSVDVSTSATLLGGQTGTVFLEIANDAAFTSGVQELCRFVNGNTVSLAIAITVTQNVTGTMTGYVPSSKWARLRTANTVGAPTFAYRSGQEVLL